MIRKQAQKYPQLSFYATRSFIVDEEGIIKGITQRVQNLEKGGNDVSNFFYHTPLQCAGIVVRRSFYEEYGGFNTSLLHSADWEMWARAISLGGGIVSPEIMSFYREFASNDTSKLMRTSENLYDFDRLNKIFSERYEKFDPCTGKSHNLARSMQMIRYFNSIGDFSAVENATKYWTNNAGFFLRFKHFLWNIKRSMNK